MALDQGPHQPESPGPHGEVYAQHPDHAVKVLNDLPFRESTPAGTGDGEKYPNAIQGPERRGPVRPAPGSRRRDQRLADPLAVPKAWRDLRLIDAEARAQGLPTSGYLSNSVDPPRGSPKRSRPSLTPGSTWSRLSAMVYRARSSLTAAAFASSRSRCCCLRAARIASRWVRASATSLAEALRVARLLLGQDVLCERRVDLHARRMHRGRVRQFPRRRLVERRPEPAVLPVGRADRQEPRFAPELRRRRLQGLKDTVRGRRVPDLPLAREVRRLVQHAHARRRHGSRGSSAERPDRQPAPPTAT